AVDMHRAVFERVDRSDVVVMAAAVADYAAADPAAQKITKTGETLTVTLKRNPDILEDLGRRRSTSGARPLLVGFAAETEDVVARARAKRERKHADLIVANDVSREDAGFDVDTNAVTLIGAAGAETLPLQSKARVAAEILDRVESLLAQRSAASEVRR